MHFRFISQLITYGVWTMDEYLPCQKLTGLNEAGLNLEGAFLETIRLIHQCEAERSYAAVSRLPCMQGRKIALR
jgi:hypothetical protein